MKQTLFDEKKYTALSGDSEPDFTSVEDIKQYPEYQTVKKIYNSLTSNKDRRKFAFAIRYKTIDKCLRNKYRRWTIEGLVEVYQDALYDCEGITNGVSMRTVQSDIQIMRSNKLRQYSQKIIKENHECRHHFFNKKN